MGLVLVCPECQGKVAMQAQSCPYCQADLRHLPQERRRYDLGQPGPPTPPPAPEPEPVPEAVTTAIPVLESAGVPETTPAASWPGKIRRPHVRRYAAPPVSETHPVTVTSPKAVEAKTEAKKTKKPKAAAKKKK